jgi:hypothetical protein
MVLSLMYLPRLGIEVTTRYVAQPPSMSAIVQPKARTGFSFLHLYGSLRSRACKWDVVSRDTCSEEACSFCKPRTCACAFGASTGHEAWSMNCVGFRPAEWRPDVGGQRGC